VIHVGNSFSLVVDAPYVKLKVWPLQPGENNASDRKTLRLDMSEWHLKVRVFPVVQIESHYCSNYIIDQVDFLIHI